MCGKMLFLSKKKNPKTTTINRIQIKLVILIGKNVLTIAIKVTDRAWKHEQGLYDKYQCLRTGDATDAKPYIPLHVVVLFLQLFKNGAILVLQNGKKQFP